MHARHAYPPDRRPQVQRAGDRQVRLHTVLAVGPLPAQRHARPLQQCRQDLGAARRMGTHQYRRHREGRQRRRLRRERAAPAASALQQDARAFRSQQPGGEVQHALQITPGVVPQVQRHPRPGRHGRAQLVPQGAGEAAQLHEQQPALEPLHPPQRGRALDPADAVGVGRWPADQAETGGVVAYQPAGGAQRVLAAGGLHRPPLCGVEWQAPGERSGPRGGCREGRAERQDGEDDAPHRPKVSGSS
ncbi:hypothetical protein HRbin39_00582 [bacterium HR39]|nr:hypothetical protein HRbin39_00582 [bacterium HR39]